MAARLTERPGSSDYFAGGVVSYSNEAKAELLGVDPALIERHGAVSPEVAEAMADGALERFEADTAVAITGRGRARRRHRGEAGRATCAGASSAPTGRSSCATCACRATGRDARPLDDGGDAPAAAPAERGGASTSERAAARACSSRSTCPRTARAALAAWRDALVAGRDDLRPVRAEALHVTLVFLGWQDESAAEAIARGGASGRAGGPARRCCAPDGVRPLPPRDPRLFALDLDDEDGRASARAGGGVRTRSAAGGWYRPEKRPFWPHVTLARVKRGERRVAPLPDAPAARRAFARAAS